MLYLLASPSVAPHSLGSAGAGFVLFCLIRILLQDLDKYFSRDPAKAKANLDTELDDYMKKRETADAAQ